MEPLKPGWKTSEFWLKALVVGAVLPFLAWMVSKGFGEGGIPSWLTPVLETGIAGLVAWLAKRYGDARKELKLARIEASTES